MDSDDVVVQQQKCRHCGAKLGEGCTTKFRSGKPTKPHKVGRDDLVYWREEGR